MKKKIIYISILLLIAWFWSCKLNKRPEINIDNLHIAMPHDWKEITGMDSIQLIVGGKYRYDESKHDYVKVQDSVYANFCYPNKWEGERFKQHVTFIHDTIYLKPKHKKEVNYDMANDTIVHLCNQAQKEFNVTYWRTQCELVKHHNEVMPEDSWALPQLSPDSCMVSFPL